VSGARRPSAADKAREKGGREGERRKASERASERASEQRTLLPANREDTRTRGWSGWKKWVARGCQEGGDRGGEIARFVRRVRRQSL